MPFIATFIQTLATLLNPRSWPLMIRVALTAFALGILFIVCVSTALAYTHIFQDTRLDMVADWIGGLGASVIAWLLLPALIPLAAGFYEERLIQLTAPHTHIAPHPFWPNLASDLRFMGVSALLNIVCMPLFFIPVIGWLGYIVLNGYLLGREFFNTSAGYFIGKPQAETLRRQYVIGVWLAGAGLALLALVPLLNMFVPCIGVIWLTHMYRRIAQANT